jgi:hypothetical protein
MSIILRKKSVLARPSLDRPYQFHSHSQQWAITPRLSGHDFPCRTSFLGSEGKVESAVIRPKAFSFTHRTKVFADGSVQKNNA